MLPSTQDQGDDADSSANTFYGISRETKRKALRDYERAGLIKVRKDGNHAVVVTLVAATAADRINKTAPPNERR